MSVCQSWFGVARSKDRGTAGLCCGFGLRCLSRVSAWRVRRTVSRLTGRNRTRRRNWLIFWIPKSGWRRFRATACRFTAGATWGFRFRGCRGFPSRPASPCVR